MPTGYTADIKDGISFKTFALNCARAFGACVTLRDEPGGGESIPDEFTASSYHVEAVAKARDELASLDAATPDLLERCAANAYDAAETARVVHLGELEAQRTAYEAMLAEVRAWTPPTPDHTGLREFMESQITQSIDFDCDESYYNKPTPRVTGSEWAATRRACLQRDIAYHEKEHAAEVERAAARTRWVQALRQALA